MGTLAGRVTDGLTGDPLAGVAITVVGSETRSAQTNAEGHYAITDITPGEVSLTASLNGYLDTRVTVTVLAGQRVDFTPALVRDPAPVSLRIDGVVLDAGTGSPLAGADVLITSSPIQTRTVADGSFSLSGLAAGSYAVEISIPGYAAMVYAISAPSGGEVNLGIIELFPVEVGATAGSVAGRITDAQTGEPLHGVEISLSGADDRLVYTGMDGRFQMTDVAPGGVTLSALLNGYRNASGSGTITAGTMLNFTVELVREGNPAFVTIIGRVEDNQTQAPLEGVLVRETGNGNEVLTCADGSFLMTEVPAGTFSIHISQTGYVGLTYSLSAPGGGLADLGRVALAPDLPVTANQGPVIHSVGPVHAVAGQLYEYPVQAYDPDGDLLTYGISSYPSGMEIDPASGMIRWIPTTDQAGPQTFTLVVSDENGAVTEETVTVNVQVNSYPTYVVTDVETLNGLTVDERVPGNYALGAYVSGGRDGSWKADSPDGCGFSYSSQAGDPASVRQAAESLDFWSMGSGYGSDAIWDLGSRFSTVPVFPLIDQAPLPEEGIKQTVWGSNDPDAPFPDGWRLATLVTIYGQGWADNRAVCNTAVNIDDYVGLYTFGADTFQYIRLKADNSISLFSTPDHTGYSTQGDDSGLPGWQSVESEIDAVGGMVCDVKPIAEAGETILGQTGEEIRFDASGSQGNIRIYGWDLDGDSEIDLTGPNPIHIFNAGFDRDVTLLVVDGQGCVGADTVRVTIGLNYPRPDLTIPSITLQGTSTNLFTLAISGSAQVTVRNRGKAAAIQPALVTLFEDTNGNGIFDAVTDNSLGAQTMPNGLARDAEVTFDLPLNGSVAFRGSPILAMVDSGQGIEEQREDNNTGSTVNQCVIVPSDIGSFEPVVKWHWSGSPTLPAYNQVMAAPIVVPLEDTNQDGRIDQHDTPAIIFHAFRRHYYHNDGVLRAISGEDGHELWTVTDPAYRTSPGSSLAAADIDGDGLIEIIALKSSGGLIAFEHTGEFKWQSSVTYTGFRDTDGIAIANLDGVGAPEVIVGNAVYNADGTLRWQGTGYSGAGKLSIVADIDLDGNPEIVAGAAAYSNTGQRLWQNTTAGNGFVAVGNFIEDLYPEIVVVSRGRVSLLDRNGSIIWGPVYTPGGGGGAPTVADMDGDGLPEIGVAGARKYVVFDTDGSLLWTSDIRDYSSNVTGSSVFDFDGDGQAEVVYNDEQYLRVYGGSDGTLLFEEPNTSGTLVELPVIADVDNDSHADMVVCSNQLFFGGKTGILVYQDANNSWLNTRKIWNQHTYHIDNINDDGTVPLVEQSSWLTHNSYRLNAFPDRDPTRLVDLTASMLEVIDNGAGRPASLSVRIGNAGAGALPDPAAIAFYEGDPDNGGLLLGRVSVNDLAVGEYIDVTLENITLTGTADITAVADYDERLIECNEANNRVSLPVLAQSSAGKIWVATHMPVYGPGMPVELQASVANTSGVPGEFRAGLRVEDAHGTVIQTYAQQAAGPLAGGAAVNLGELWNTADYQAGAYQLHGLLYSLDGLLIDESSSVFEIRHAVGDLPLATLRTTTDRPRYHTTDTAQLANLARNLAGNTVIADAGLRVIVTNPSGDGIFTHTQTLGELASGALRDDITPYRFVNALEGIYTVRGELTDSAGNLLATDQTTYEVAADLQKDLAGDVAVRFKIVERGLAQVCTDTLTYSGNQPLSAQPIRQLLINLESAERVAGHDATVTLAPGATERLTRTIATHNLAEGAYSCLLQAQLAGEWTRLAHGNFTVIVPPIDIAGTLEQADAPRLLVLLDGIRHCERDDGDDDHDDEDSDDDRDDDDDNDECGGANNGTDPHGPSNAPLLSEQRGYLEDILTVKGWSHTIVTDADAFTQELRSGAYTAYALFSEQVKLAEQVQEELREAIFRGEGLLLAGDHDHRHNKLDNVLGVKVKGSLPAPDTIDIDLVEHFLAGSAGFTLIERPRRIELRGAEAIAGYPGVTACSGDDDDNDGDDDDDGDDDGDHQNCNSPAIAVTHNDYGYGHSVYAGFDLLAQAALADADPLFTELLFDALEAIEPDSATPLTGSVVSLRLALANQGIATPGQAIITLPAGSRVIDPGAATSQPGGSLLWAFDLAEDATATLTFWQQLPDMAGAADIEALLMTGVAPDLVDHDNLLLTLNLGQTPGLTELLDELAALKLQHKAYKTAHEKVEKALKYMDQGRYGKALREALKAADYLAGLEHPDAKAVRRQLALAIRELEWLLP